MAATPDPELIVALDFTDRDEAMALLQRLDPALCRIKVGKELFTRCGPGLIEGIHNRGFEVFLDLKFHDIPNTVAGACRAAADLGVWMVNVHALGGRRMLLAAREALDERVGGKTPLLIAVTVLTSMEFADLADIGFDAEPAELADRLAALAAGAGCDGVVCSGHEATALRAAHGRNFLLVTPGIRPVAAAADDQRRILTPEQARAAGADYLVVGRPVTRAADPAAVLRDLAVAARNGH